MIAAAIVAALAIPAVLIILGWGPGTTRQPGRRFKSSVAIGWASFVIIAILLGEPAHPLDWLAGVAVLVTMTLAIFVVWSMVVWGFTLNMLLTLERSPHPLDLDAWANRYTGGRSIHQICLDRLDILLMFKLAYLQSDTVQLVAGTGRIAAAVSEVIRYLFGVPGTR
jgi:hypothetical protein